MKTNVLPIPGLVLGAYPERRPQRRNTRPVWSDRSGNLSTHLFRRDAFKPFLERVSAFHTKVSALDSTEIAALIQQTRAAMARYGLRDELVAQAFAVVKRVCAQEIGMEIFPTQLMAARIMLDGHLAEMATGEGKTLAAGICATTAALAGIPVHLITANEYLVRRDAQLLEPLYASLGLRVSILTQALATEERRHVYASDVVYCTASELAFDYLRDGLLRNKSRSDVQDRVSRIGPFAKSGGSPVMRGLCMAIIDEADSVLIDEARVPLILSARQSVEGVRERFQTAFALAKDLREGADYTLDDAQMSAVLSEEGRGRLDRLAPDSSSSWRNRLHRNEVVSAALAALHLYQKDRHYVVRDGAVHIVDETTGRIAAGRIWSRGLHALIGVKEGCEHSEETAIVAQITYQRFFDRYLILGGMSGTLQEAKSELLSTYGLRAMKVPLRRSNRRTVLPTRLYRNRDLQWEAVVAQIQTVHSSGRPVLVGTDSIVESETLSRRLAQASIAHDVLNAHQNQTEAQIIARAGRHGAVTVATNMAGRGTDIVLASHVAALGGLHVICCQHNGARRIDRQLIGRCGRQGDPGSAQTLIALEQPLMTRYVPAWVSRLVPDGGLERPQWLVRLLVTVPQLLEERRQRVQRRELLRSDIQTEQHLTFGTSFE